MAIIQADFYSRALSKITEFSVVLPNDLFPEMTAANECYKRAMKTVFLLHGFSGSNKDWLFGSSVQEMAAKYNLVVVMPSGDNSFYLDAKGTGKAYCQFIGNELTAYVNKTFGLSDKKEDTFIGGFSMGGFGAIHTGLAFPDTFGKIVALSSALIIHNIENLKPDFKDPLADYDYYASVFGDLTQLENSVNNPECLIHRMKKDGRAIPPIYMACGTEDFLINENRAFHQFLLDEAVPVIYQESPGIHNWTFWNACLEPSIQWLLA